MRATERFDACVIHASSHAERQLGGGRRLAQTVALANALGKQTRPLASVVRVSVSILPFLPSFCNITLSPEVVKWDHPTTITPTDRFTWPRCAWSASGLGYPWARSRGALASTTGDLSRLENGKVHDPRSSTLTRYARALGKRVGECIVFDIGGHKHRLITHIDVLADLVDWQLGRIRVLNRRESRNRLEVQRKIFGPA